MSLHEHEGVANIRGTVESDDEQVAEAWVAALLKKAYGMPQACYGEKCRLPAEILSTPLSNAAAKQMVRSVTNT